MSKLQVKSVKKPLEASDFLIPETAGSGPVSKYYKWRTLFQYLVLVGSGIAVWVKSDNSSFRSAAIGLFFPGGSYLAAPSWINIGLFVFTVVMLPVTFFIWFGTGAILFIILNYIAPIGIGAYLNRGTTLWIGAPYVVGGFALVTFGTFYIISAKEVAANHKKRNERNSYIPELCLEIAKRERPDPTNRELDFKTLKFVKYFIEKGLRGMDDWELFDDIDQFQTASLRYQLYEIVYDLSTYQAIYAPSARGKISEAQTNVIEKSLQEKVMSYWKWESLLGHFTLDFDPIVWDNIMVSGFFLKALSLFTNATGDMRYAVPDCLEFVITDKKRYKHDIHLINKHLLRNWDKHAYSIFPCEPNWIYTPCNLYGSCGAMGYDKAFSQDNFEKRRSNVFKGLQEELSTQLGTLLPIKSSYTGMTIPGLAGPSAEACLAIDIGLLNEAAGIRTYVTLREETLRYDPESKQYEFEGLAGSDMIDSGNYTRSKGGVLSAFAVCAAENGDQEIADDLLRQLDENVCPVQETDIGSYYNKGLSGWQSGMALRSRFIKFGDWKHAVTQGAPPQCKSGPLLFDYDYKYVLVARAFSNNGRDLDLVLYNDKRTGSFSLRLAQLIPGCQYKYSEGKQFTATEGGEAVISVKIDGRTHIYIEPM